jgi:short-subunit dehydrogenase
MALPPPDPTSTCLVTGASSGIGTEFARQLAAKGFGVFLVARREDRLRELADEIEREHGVRVEVASADLEQRAAYEALPGTIAERGLTVDILVNNAGFTTVGDVHSNPDRQLGMIRVNCEALVALTSAFLPGMVERGRGAVINVASTASFQPIPAQAVYAASKAFVRSFSEAVSSEVKGTGVSVTALCPGPVATEFVEAGGFKKGADEMPSFLFSSAEDVARAGIEGARKDKRVVIPGIGNRVTAKFGQYAPHSVLLGPMASAYRRSIGE